MELGDGRTLAYEDWGPRDGTPVLFQHGTGDSRLCRHPDHAILDQVGVRLETADRPGVGGSSVRKHRSLLDWVPDVEALADHVGIDTFVVAGYSGGGPHALAVATTLPERVTKVVLASPLVPFDEPHGQDLVLDAEVKSVFRLHHLKWLARAGASAEAHHYAKHLDAFVEHCAKSYPADRDLFLDPDLRPMFEAEFGEAMRHGGQGSLADFWAFEDWGFRLEDVTLPAVVFGGDADTILDPAGLEVYGRRPGQVTVRTWPGAGRYGCYARDRWTEMLSATT